MMTTITALKMPKWGMAMTEGKIVDWLAEDGAPIEAGDEILEVETEKITNVLEAPASGVLRRRLADDGDVRPIGALLAVICDPQTPDEEIDRFVDQFTIEEEAEQGVSEAEPEFVEAGGKRLRVLSMGSGGEPVVLVHGFGGDLKNWLFNQPALAEGRQTVAFDLPGHGESVKDVGAGTPDALAGDLLALLDALDLARVHVVGHSLGGMIGHALAHAAPDRVASLTLIGSRGLGTRVDLSYIDSFLAANRRKEMKPVLARLFADPGLVSRDMINEVLKFKRLDGVDAALEKLAAALRDEASAIPPALPATTQIIWGTDDRVAPISQLAGLDPALAVHRLDGVGHMAHMEAASAINRLIEGFVTEE